MSTNLTASFPSKAANYFQVVKKILAFYVMFVAFTLPGLTDAQIRGRQTQPQKFGRLTRQTPDLTVQIERLGQTATFRQGKFVVPCRVLVKNRGKVAADRIRIEMFFDTNSKVAIPTGQATFSTRRPLRRIAPGQSVKLDGVISIPGIQSLQDKTVYVRAKIKTAMRETNTRNNWSAMANFKTPKVTPGGNGNSRPNSLRPNRPNTRPVRPGNWRPGQGKPQTGRPQTGKPQTGNLVIGPTRPTRPGSVVGNGGNPKPNPNGFPGAGEVATQFVIANAYRGNDGGAYYFRRVGSKVYFFGEHPGNKNYACVFTGEFQNGKIKGYWWDLPKGGRTGKGQVHFSIKSKGDRLDVSHQIGGFGVTRLEKIKMGSFQLPGKRSPSFYSTKSSDLDGRWFSGSTMMYIREIDDYIVGVSESEIKSNQQPTTVRIIIGKRKSGSNMSMDYVDVPKGKSTLHGHVNLHIDDAFRIKLGNQAYLRDVVDFAKLEQNLINKFKNKCVGFGYAIAFNGKIVHHGGRGYRKLSQDGGNKAFDGKTQKPCQSTSKTLTAIAAMHALHKHGISVDDRISPYLPRYWKLGPQVSSLTFRELLTHKSGLKGVGDPDEYGNLKKCIANGVVASRGSYDYENANFAMFRVILPYITHSQDMHNFEENGIRGDNLNKRCAKRFLDYMQKNVYNKAGINSLIGTAYTSQNHAFLYNYKKQSAKGHQQQSNQFYECGAGSFVLSAHQYTQVLAAFDNGKIVPKSVVKQMKDGRIGFRGVTGKLGTYFNHNGALGSESNDAYGHGRGGRASQMIFSNNVQIMVQINSANNKTGAESSNQLTNSLKDAFDKALR